MRKIGCIVLLTLIGAFIVGCQSSTKGSQSLPMGGAVITNDTTLFVVQQPQYEQLSRRQKLARGYQSTFNDKNDLHLEAALECGITPINDINNAGHRSFASLSLIDSCQYYDVRKLTHSAPYLTPHAKWLLMTIGKNFQDSLAAQGVYGYQLSVTSVLRTDKSIENLQRRNSNASDNSAHRYGTTFDISYTKYNRTDTTTSLPEWQVKETFSEVLYDLRERGLCYVKYEVKQGCFHITARKP